MKCAHRQLGVASGYSGGWQRAGKRAGIVPSLIESAKLNGHEPWAYLEEALERMPTLKTRDLGCVLALQFAIPGCQRDRWRRAECYDT